MHIRILLSRAQGWAERQQVSRVSTSYASTNKIQVTCIKTLLTNLLIELKQGIYLPPQDLGQNTKMDIKLKYRTLIPFLFYSKFISNLTYNLCKYMYFPFLWWKHFLASGMQSTTIPGINWIQKISTMLFEAKGPQELWIRPKENTVFHSSPPLKELSLIFTG